MRFSSLFTPPLLLLLALLALCTATQPEERMVMPGSYSPIQNLEEDHVVAAASFAVEQALSSKQFSFDQHLKAEDVTATIVRGFKQVVAGLNYKLVIVLITKDHAEPDPSLHEIVGCFGVTVYDHFGDLSVTKWGKQLSAKQAKALLENRDEFGEEVNPFDE